MSLSLKRWQLEGGRWLRLQDNAKSLRCAIYPTSVLCSGGLGWEQGKDPHSPR